MKSGLYGAVTHLDHHAEACDQGVGSCGGSDAGKTDMAYGS